MTRNPAIRRVGALRQERADALPWAVGAPGLDDGLDGVVFEYRQWADGGHHLAFVGGDALALCGVEPAEVLASADHFLALIVPGDLPSCVAHPERPLVDAAAQAVFRLRHARTGELRWLRARAGAPRRAAEATVWRGHMVDITEQKRLEVAWTEARLEADEAARAKRDFLANMSHEIRTPINAIVGLSHLVLKAGLTPRQHDYVDKIHEAAQSLLGIVNGLLDLSRMETGSLVMAHVEFDLLEVLDRLAGPVGAAAHAKDLAFRVSTGSDLPYYLTGDPERLGQVLLALVGNAVKFTAQGRVELDVSEVAGARRETETRLRFTVTDTGIGLAPEQVRIFEAFSQADTGRTRRYGGAGLGLTISRQLVERMGGEIGVESTPGRGSVFWFAVPLGLAAGRPPATTAGMPSGAPAPAVDEPASGVAAVFNRAEGLDRIRNEEKLFELCRQFLGQNRDRLAELATLLARGATREAGALVHALAGSAALLGFDQLAEAARRLEHEIKAGHAAGPDMAGVAAAHARAEAAFVAAGSTPAEGEAAPAPVTGEVLPLLDELGAQIDDFDIQAFETFRGLRRGLGHAQKALLAQLESQLKDFDFVAAAESLAQLRAALAP